MAKVTAVLAASKEALVKDSILPLNKATKMPPNIRVTKIVLIAELLLG
jgi:hypothetical protein